MSISFENCRQEINIELFYAKRAHFCTGARVYVGQEKEFFLGTMQACKPTYGYAEDSMISFQ